MVLGQLHLKDLQVSDIQATGMKCRQPEHLEVEEVI